MKINPHSIQDHHLERTQGRANEKLGARGNDVQDVKRYQVGLDRVEVSNLADTAAEIVNKAAQNRDARITQLTGLFLAQQLTVNPEQLANSIIDHDLNLDSGDE